MISPLYPSSCGEGSGEWLNLSLKKVRISSRRWNHFYPAVPWRAGPHPNSGKMPPLRCSGMKQILNSTGDEGPSKQSTARGTMTLISNQEEIICIDPAYHGRTGSRPTMNFGMSCIVAHPRSDLRIAEICYVELSSGLKPVVVAIQKDGSIRMSGAYVDSIAQELKLTADRPSNKTSGKSKAWARAVDDGWQIRGIAPAGSAASKPAPGWNGYRSNPAK